MKVSIITINLNNANGLEKTLISVANQTYKNIEYIVVDGGSKDDSNAIARYHQDQIAHFISERDNGIYHAMNKGITMATGDYLLFLNSGDVLLDPLVIEKVVSEGLNEDLVYGDLTFSDAEKEWTWYLPDVLTFEHFYQNTIPHPSTFIRRQLFEKVGYYDEKLSIVSDWKFFMLALARYNCSYKHISMVVSVYDFDGLSSKPESLPLINSERLKVLQDEFPFFVKDYENMIRLKDEMKKINYFIRTRRSIRSFLKK